MLTTMHPYAVYVPAYLHSYLYFILYHNLFFNSVSVLLFLV